jgi:hypothetical protein
METNTNPEAGDDETPEPEQQQAGQPGEETPQPSSPEEEVAPEGHTVGE